MPADIDACVSAMEGKPGVENAFALCNWMKAEGKGYFAASPPSDYTAIIAEYAASQKLTAATQAGEIRFHLPITRIDEEAHMVYGVGVSTQPPSSGKEPIAWDAIKAAIPEYMKFGNVREMHQLSAVGKTKEVEVNEAEQLIALGIKVVDDMAWTKVKEGVYSGISVGGQKATVKDGMITAMSIDEFSLVDRPDIPNCTFSLWRRASTDENVEGAAMPDIKEIIGNLSAAATAGDITIEEALGQIVRAFSQVIVNAATAEAAKVAGEEAPAPADTEEAVVAAITSGNLQRRRTRYSKKTVSALTNVLRLVQQLLGVKIMSDKQIAQAAMDNEKTEAAIATAAALEEQAERDTATLEDEEALKKKKPAETSVEEEVAEPVAAAVTAEITRAVKAALDPVNAKVERLEQENKALMATVKAPNLRTHAVSKDGEAGVLTGAEKASLQELCDDAFKRNDTVELLKFIQGGIKPSKEAIELRRNGGAPSATTKEGVR